MDEVKKLLDEKITVLNDFDMNTEKLRKKSTKERVGPAHGLMEYIFDGVTFGEKS